MIEIVQANWPLYAGLAVLVLLVAWWLLSRASRSAPRRHHRPDVLDEGAAPAKRNQALIDLPPAAAIVPPTTVDTMGGLGEVIAAGAREEIAEAEAVAREAKEAAEAQAAPARESGDEMGKLKGVGPKLVTLLKSLGIVTYAEIAAWTEADIDRVDAQLGAFAGRIRRDNWIEQAKLLADGDQAAYEAKFGKL